MALPTYTVGTISVTNGGTTVTGVGTLFNTGVNAREGDYFVRSDGMSVITSLTSDTSFEITPWPGATVVSGGSYIIQQNYVGRVVGVAAAKDVASLLTALASAAYTSADNTFTGKQSFTNTTEATGVGSVAAALFAGGVEIAKKLFVAGAVSLSSAVALGGTISPSQITSDQNNYSPTNLSSSSLLRLSTDASRNITGLAAGGNGELKIIHNVGSFNIVLKDDDGATSTAANRFALTSDVTLLPDSTCLLQYDATSARWRIVGGSGSGLFTTPVSMTMSSALANGKSALSITATQPTTPVATQNAVSLSITGAGSASQINRAFNVDYLAGYTGSSTTAAGRFMNASAGTGNTVVPASGSNTAVGNVGANLGSTATAASANIGGYAHASGGDVSVGLLGLAQINKNSAKNIGVVGSGFNGGTSPVQIGGFFSLNQTTLPSVSAGLIADNGSQTNAIFLARDNGSTVFTIADGGAVTLTGSITVGGKTTSSLREVATGSRTYYVRTDGSNSNTGLVDSAGGAFLTIQKAIDVIKIIDWAGFTPTIQIGGSGAGRAFNANVSLNTALIGTQNIQLVGDNTTPGNVTITLSTNNGIYCTGAGANIDISGFKFAVTGNFAALKAENGAILRCINLVEFGTCSYGIVGQYGGRVYMFTNYTISGGAVNHIFVATGGYVLAGSGNTVTVSGTPAFSGSFASAVTTGQIEAASITYSGSATGQRETINTAGGINTFGGATTFFPGNAYTAPTSPGWRG